MKASRTVVGLLLAVLSVFLWGHVRSPSEAGLVIPERGEPRPLETSVASPEPSPPIEKPSVVAAPVAIEEPKQPVQSLEERGDAMLFESEVLMGTPFDQAIVMPFD